MRAKRLAALGLSVPLLISTVPAAYADEKQAISISDIQTAQTSAEASGICGKDATWALTDDGTLTISGSGDMNDYSLDSAPWITYKTQIKSVKIYNGVTSIGEYAFASCKVIEGANIADSVSKIGASAFYRCSKLKSVSISANVKEISNHAFYLCAELEEINIENGVERIGEKAFASCPSLSKVTIPESVNYIGNNAFAMGSISNALQEIRFLGNAPEFGTKEVFKKVTATAYYPQDDTTWTAEIMENCGGTITWVEKDPCEGGHTLTLVEAKPETCINAGNRAYWTCGVCGKIFADENAQTETTVDAQTLKKKPHNGITLEEEKATCIKTGLSEGSKCSYCNLIIIEQKELPLTEHQYDEGAVITDATCTEKGEIQYKCRVCQKNKNEAIQAEGHNWITIDSVPASCTEVGSGEGLKCSKCDMVAQEPEVIASIGHKYDSGTITTKPTCTTDGIRTYICQSCGDKETEKIDATGHKEEVLEAEVQTCTKTGLTEGMKCKTCGEILKAQYKIKAIGHDYDSGEITTEPTCVENGVKTYTCKNCDHERSENIAIVGHTEKVLEAVAPNCTKAGLTEGLKCETCGEVLKSQKKIDAIAHDYDLGEITTEPTCVEKGVKTYTCKKCGHEKTEDIPALGHTEENLEAVEPTCTATGLTEGLKCKTCGEILKEQEKIKPNDHHFIEISAKTATCEEFGNDIYWICSDCGKMFDDINGINETTLSQQTINADGHSETIIPAVQATCTEDGLTEGTICSKCNKVIKTQKIVPASGHEIVSEPAVKATVDKSGKTASEYCSKCNTVLKSSKKIYKASHINLSRTSYKYNGKKRTPKVVVCDSRENLISSKNYTVKYSKGRKNVGKYKVTVKFKGKKYSGSKTLYFEIKE